MNIYQVVERLMIYLTGVTARYSSAILFVRIPNRNAARWNQYWEIHYGKSKTGAGMVSGYE